MRDPEHQFVDAGVDELAASLVREYERLAGTTVQPGSPERVIIQWAAGIIVHERVLMNYIGSQNIPSRADGENLDPLLAVSTGLKHGFGAFHIVSDHLDNLWPVLLLDRFLHVFDQLDNQRDGGCQASQ